MEKEKSTNASRKRIGLSKYVIVGVLVVIVAIAGVATYWLMRPTDTPPSTSVTLTLCGWTGGDSISLKAAADFMELHPNVKIDYLTWAAADYYEKIVSLMLVQPQKADIISVDWGYSRNFATVPFIHDIESFPETAELKSRLSTAALNLFTIDGKLYGLPSFVGEYMCFWNKEDFAKINITEPPTTWAGLMEAMVKFKQEGIYDKPLMPGFTATVWYGAQVDWVMLTANIGGKDAKLFGPGPDYEPLFLNSSSPGYKAAQLMVDMKQKYDLLDPAAMESTVTEQKNAAMAGLIPFVLRASSHDVDDLNGNKSQTQGQWDIFPAPDAGWNIVRGAYYALTTNLMTKKDANTQKWAWEFLKFIGGPAYSKLSYMSKLEGFGWKELWNDPEIVAQTQKYCSVDLLQQVQATSVPVSTVASVYDSVFFPEWRLTSSVWLQDAMNGKKTLDEALQGIADMTANLVDKYS